MVNSDKLFLSKILKDTESNTVFFRFMKIFFQTFMNGCKKVTA